MERVPLRVVIIGAGYAGMLATVRLAGWLKRPMRTGDLTVTLVNAADSFVERVRLHQFAANQPLPNRPITRILRGTGVTFKRGLVTGIDTAQHTLRVQTGAGSEQISYDKLVYALGSTINQDSVPGVREHAYVLTPSGPRSAAALRDFLAALHPPDRRGRVLVCGAGATGVEAAAEFASAYPQLDVQLLTQGEFASFTDRDVADYMRRTLNGWGVTIRDRTRVVEVRADAVLTADGRSFPFDACLWAGGFAVPALAREAGIAVNERSQILVDSYLRSITQPDIYAMGDAATPVEAPGGIPVRMSAFTAIVMGAQGADSLVASIQGCAPQPFNFTYMGQGIALGRGHGIGFGLLPSDRPKRPYFTGRMGYTIREFFVRFLAILPTLERTWPGFFRMGQGPQPMTAIPTLRPGAAPAAHPQDSL